MDVLLLVGVGGESNSSTYSDKSESVFPAENKTSHARKSTCLVCMGED